MCREGSRPASISRHVRDSEPNRDKILDLALLALPLFADRSDPRGSLDVTIGIGAGIFRKCGIQWQSDAALQWRTQAFSQHVFGERSNSVVAFAGRRLASGAAIGPQIASSGDPNYRIHGAALALNGLKVGPSEIGVYLGAQRLEGGKTQIQAGLSFVLYRP